MEERKGRSVSSTSEGRTDRQEKEIEEARQDDALVLLVSDFE
jgi:hypothetical protein